MWISIKRGNFQGGEFNMAAPVRTLLGKKMNKQLIGKRMIPLCTLQEDLCLFYIHVDSEQVDNAAQQVCNFQILLMPWFNVFFGIRFTLCDFSWFRYSCLPWLLIHSCFSRLIIIFVFWTVLAYWTVLWFPLLRHCLFVHKFNFSFHCLFNQIIIAMWSLMLHK